MSEDAKETLVRYLAVQRDALRWKLEGVSEREARMPMTPTGTNLLLAPATIVVTSTADAGPGTLRAALDAAQDGDVIGFDPSIGGQTIVVATRLIVDKSVTIQGSQTSGMTLSGGGSSGVLNVQES